MRFESPWALLILLLIPMAVWVHFRLRGSGSLHFSTTENAERVRPSLRQRLVLLPLWLRVIALILLTIGLARPQAGTEKVRDVSQGIAIEMVVDRSGSMGAEMDYAGVRTNRLDVVKRVFHDFVAGNGGDLPGRPNDLIGMIAFARYADTVCPLTLAHGALGKLLDNVQLVTRKNEDGTAIGEAIALAAARLKTAGETLARQTGGNPADFEIKSRIMILLTDGQNNAGTRTPTEAAELAKEWGIRIYNIGVGGDDPQPGSDLFGRFFAMAGRGVDTRTLQQVADITGGRFFLAEDADSLRDIYAMIDKLEKSEIESTRYVDYREMFAPLLYAGLLLLCLEMALSCTVFRRIP